MAEVIGIDHIYISVSDINRSEIFYDDLLEVLGFRKSTFQLDNEKHIQYYNRLFGYVLRPARVNRQNDPYAPGLHHLCLRVESDTDIIEVAKAIEEKGIIVSEPKKYPEYAPDYFAVYLSDPDGIKLEITNYRQERRERHRNW